MSGLSLDFVFRTCTGKDCAYWSGCGELDWFDKYADPREDAGKGVLTADWNRFPHNLDNVWYSRDLEQVETAKQAQAFNWGKGRKFQDILECMGYKLEWRDQTTRCDHCYGCIQTDAQYYGDSAHYAILGECDTVCEHCIREECAEEYLEGMEDNPRTAAFIRGVNPADHGYIEIQCGYEAGFHAGQTDDPKKIFDAMVDRGYERIVFEISDAGQFDIHFCAWVKVTPLMSYAYGSDGGKGVVYEGEPVEYSEVAL